MTDDTKHTRSFAIMILYATTKIALEIYANSKTILAYMHLPKFSVVYVQ